MPAALALPAFWGAVTAGAAGTAGVIGAHMQSGAANDAATLQTQAANHAADVQGKTAADTIAFQRQQAENDYQNQETTRQANYGQWLAKQKSNNTIRQALGLRAVETPAYVPSVDPNFQQTPTAPPSSINGAMRY